MQHLAIIMDGNRRWAQKRGLSAWQGHREGVSALERAIQFCIRHKIPYLSVYAFSVENFNRSAQELHYLFNIIAQELVQSGVDRFVDKGISIKFIGDRSLFPASLVDVITNTERKTANGKTLRLNMLFCYGGQQEIIHGVKTLVQKIREGVLTENDISEKTFGQCLWSADNPDPDLIIRTGGAQRLSNFLLYQAAYTELLFLDLFWPDITEEHLTQALIEFEQRKRNFGK